MQIDAALLDGCIALNLAKTPTGWQASVERRRGSFSIGQGSTPGEAVLDALRILVIAPPPY